MVNLYIHILITLNIHINIIVYSSYCDFIIRLKLINIELITLSKQKREEIELFPTALSPSMTTFTSLLVPGLFYLVLIPFFGVFFYSFPSQHINYY